VIPKLLQTFTVYAIDFRGMGWSDITPGDHYTEPELRRAVVEFLRAAAAAIRGWHMRSFATWGA